VGDVSELTAIDHVAVAVHDLEAAIAYYRDTFGAEVTHREVVERDGVEEALLAVADSYIQLLTPIRDDSPVAKSLATRGEGLHHVGYRVDDCAGARRWRSCTRSPRSGPSSSWSRNKGRRAPGDPTLS